MIDYPKRWKQVQAMRKVTHTDIYDSEGNFLFTQTLTSYFDTESDFSGNDE